MTLIFRVRIAVDRASQHQTLGNTERAHLGVVLRHGRAQADGFWVYVLTEAWARSQTRNRAPGHWRIAEVWIMTWSGGMGVWEGGSASRSPCLDRSSP